MGKIKNYKDLIVWQKAHEVTLKTIKFVLSFPKDDIFREIKSQLFRATSSVEVNIAEGHSSYRGGEYTRFLEYAYRSSFEVDNWFQIIIDSPELNQKVSMKTAQNLQLLNTETIKLLTNLLKSLKQ